MLFFLVVLFPLFHGTLPAREEIQIAYAAGRRYQFVAARAIELLLLTGILNIVARGWGEGGNFPEWFWSVLGLKVVGFGVMAGLQTWQRISMNRRLAPLIVAGGGGVLGEREWRAIQSRMATLTWLNLAIGVAVVFLGLMLGRL
ncbi:MAG: hypothetical protein ACE5G5_08850 [Candidatus Methylomirabilales bacterium]